MGWQQACRIQNCLLRLTQTHGFCHRQRWTAHGVLLCFLAIAVLKIGRPLHSLAVVHCPMGAKKGQIQELPRQGQPLLRPNPLGKLPVETVAPIVLASMYETHPWVPFGESILWHMAQSYQFWLATPESPPPSRIQINCGGLGGGSLDSPTTPTFHRTHP